jgi:hypothetical protein
MKHETFLRNIVFFLLQKFQKNRSMNFSVKTAQHMCYGPSAIWNENVDNFYNSLHLKILEFTEPKILNKEKMSKINLIPKTS